MIGRREFITLIGGAAAWPLVAQAQQSRVPVIGVLRPNFPRVGETFAEPFRRYMKAIGWEDGHNARFLFVWAEGRAIAHPNWPAAVAQKVDVIITFGDPFVASCTRLGNCAGRRNGR